MRVGELLGTRVRQPGGSPAGVVIEARARAHQDPGQAPILVLDGLVLASHNWRLFGYERATEQGPLLLSWLIRCLHRNTRYARCDQVELRRDHQIRLRCDWSDLAHVHEIPE